ncbi:unnamed protein product [Rotaria magnacalcarata]|uniref:Uncharacterized protein n=1 Tax=Rotaria magnacalcarata TaxID=392030 RepID=A0A816QYA3_9BILA|nr:unnamed protein product [Rotaria magnacalcarata]CAF2249721.1 unnamed protein product [Rotaria magnacalcarata]
METDTTRRIKFNVLMLLQPPSIMCYLGLIHHILSNRLTRQAFHNNGPLILLFIGLITVAGDLSMVLNFIRSDIVRSNINVCFCVWTFFDTLLYALVCILML